MPRSARAIEANGIYHVLNRGNGKQWLFHQDGDYRDFLAILRDGLSRYPVDLFAYCLMVNHWHLLVRPRTDHALSEWLSWVGVKHVRRQYQFRQNEAGGHLYQGRFKCFPVQDDEHFLTVARYIESNPVRANLVNKAELWQWSSLTATAQLPTSDWPVDRPNHWNKLVNQPISQLSLDEIQTSLKRNRPFGSPTWTQKIATRLGLTHTLKSPGRPRKPIDQLTDRQIRRRKKSAGHNE